MSTASAVLLALPAIAQGQDVASAFLVKPYIQMGNKPLLTDPESLELMWQTQDRDEKWLVQIKRQGEEQWHDAAPPQMKAVLLPGHRTRRFFTAKLDNLPPGKPFRYRLLRAGVCVFQCSAGARKKANQPFRFAVFGDCGAGTRSQRQIACRAFLSKPDFVLIPGDIVYVHGTLAEYMLNFFPAYNQDHASQEDGAPLLRSTLFVAAPGNHDIDIAGNSLGRDLNEFPDGLAYFFLWSQPLNGPPLAVGHANTPLLIGSRQLCRGFLALAGCRYPRMSNFSFDYGNAHYLILDANAYMDWTDPELRAFVENDLECAGKAVWRFVCFHQPGFNSDIVHMQEQRMRLLSDIFQRQKVDIVFNGHTHNYQRSYPLQFTAVSTAMSPPGAVAGTWQLDKLYDGVAQTHPHGVIYLISGAGGAHLSGVRQSSDSSTWQEFTCRFISPPHSLTVCDVKGRQLSVRQIDRDGTVLDQFKIEK